VNPRRRAKSMTVDWTYVAQRTGGSVQIRKVPLKRIGQRAPRGRTQGKALAPSILTPDFERHLTAAFEAAVRRAMKG